MFVREFMTTPCVTIAPETSVPDALRLLRDRSIRRLPIVNRRGVLVGIVSDKDLLKAAPSQATSLSVWEISELLSNLRVDEIMTREVITVSEDTPIEEAAVLMADRKIGGLPVMRGDAVSGIITESDLFKVLLTLLGGRREGVRLTVKVAGGKGVLAALAAAISEVGGDIQGIGVGEFASNGGSHWEIVLKVQDVASEPLVNAVSPLVAEVVDARLA